MHLQVCGGEEKGRNTRAGSLTSSAGMMRRWAWDDEAMGVGARHVCE
jgi:hypothetical protein